VLTVSEDSKFANGRVLT